MDNNGDGCFQLGIDMPGESDPRTADTDGDRIPDHYEDRDLNGQPAAHETLPFTLTRTATV